MFPLYTGSCAFPFTGGLLQKFKATGAARKPTPRPITTSGEPIPRTGAGRHWDLNPGPPNLQTNALQTEVTDRQAKNLVTILRIIVLYFVS